LLDRDDVVPQLGEPVGQRTLAGLRLDGRDDLLGRPGFRRKFCPHFFLGRICLRIN
jgi:hypothetical protein